MPENNISFDQLSEAAQDTAVNNFGRFYVKHFRTDGLDVIAQLDRTGYIADINGFMTENSSLHSDELLEGVVARRRGNMIGLIKALGLTFDESGKPQPSLEQWYLDKKSTAIVDD